MTQISQQLRNKVMLIREPVATGKTAAIGFWFSTGSRSEPDNLRGVTHFVEHMLFKGTSSRSSFDIASAFDRMGGYVNAFTEREAVCMYCVVPSVHVEKALEILCDMTSHSSFNNADIQREKQVIKSEIITAQDDPEEASLDAVGEAVWPDQKISASISGSIADVEKLAQDDLYAWYEKRFVRGPLTVCITGNYNADSITGILEMLPEHTAHVRWSDEHEENQLLKQTPVWKSGLNFISAPFQQEQFFVLYPVAYPVSEKLYFTFAVLNAISGGTMSSRLFQRLREKGGFCYTVDSFFSYYEDTGCWCVYASSAKQESVRIISDIRMELNDLFLHSITDAELDAAKEHVCGEEMIASEDVEYRMKRLARSYQSGYTVRTTEDIIEIFRSIQKADIEEAVKMLFNDEKASVVVFGPKLKASEKQKIKGLCACKTPGEKK